MRWHITKPFNTRWLQFNIWVEATGDRVRNNSLTLFLQQLNQSLLLLAKIENRQFHDEQKIDLKKLIESKLEQFEDMIAFKKISIEKKLENTELRMNTQLADILFSNVIGNAIRHNISEGKIIIELKMIHLLFQILEIL